MSPPRGNKGDTPFSGTLADRIRHARRVVGLSQAALAKRVGVVPSAVAQWEGPGGISPTVEHLMCIAVAANIAFEWLVTGRGPIAVPDTGPPAVQMETFARDLVEERLLVAFRKLAARKREAFVAWLEGFV